MRSSLVFIMYALSCNSVFGSGQSCKMLDSNWMWFSDHVGLYATYASQSPAGRVYEVGTGISISGSPKGKRRNFSGEAEFTAYGVGAVHIRKKDTGSTFQVCLELMELGAIPIFSTDF